MQWVCKMSKERIEAEDNTEDIANSGYGGVIGLEADEDIFYYRWGKYNVGLIGKVHVVKEIMEVLSREQSQD